MGLVQTACGIVGHNWQKYSEQKNPKLAKCKRCGEVTSLEEAQRLTKVRKNTGQQGGGSGGW